MGKIDLYDIVGIKIGKLEILNYENTTLHKNKKNYHKYNCLCSCGKTKLIHRDTLTKYIKNNIQGSCGCNIAIARSRQAKERILQGKDRSQITYLYTQIKANSRYRRLEFKLSKEEFKELIFSNCHYCNNKPSNICKPKNYYEEMLYNGIDRIDSSKGYIKGNIVCCCFICNRAKMDMSYNDFISYLKRIGKIYD